jgi:hypothetical protein
MPYHRHSACPSLISSQAAGSASATAAPAAAAATAKFERAAVCTLFGFELDFALDLVCSSLGRRALRLLLLRLLLLLLEKNHRHSACLSLFSSQAASSASTTEARAAAAAAADSEIVAVSTRFPLPPLPRCSLSWSLAYYCFSFIQAPSGSVGALSHLFQ